MLVNIRTGEPVTEDQFRRSHKKTSFPKDLSAEMLEPFGFAPLEIEPRPDVTGPVKVTRKMPALVDGAWRQGWEIERLPISPRNVKAEAHRRIVAFVPEWKQRNLTAQAAILSEKGRANWTADELAAWNAGEAIWQQVALIRAASDALEAQDPIPDDFTDDRHWS